MPTARKVRGRDYEPLWPSDRDTMLINSVSDSDTRPVACFQLRSEVCTSVHTCSSTETSRFNFHFCASPEATLTKPFGRHLGATGCQRALAVCSGCLAQAGGVAAAMKQRKRLGLTHSGDADCARGTQASKRYQRLILSFSLRFQPSEWWSGCAPLSPSPAHPRPVQTSPRQHAG